MGKVVPSLPEIGSWTSSASSPENFAIFALKMVNFGAFWVASLICNATGCASYNFQWRFLQHKNTFQRFQGMAIAPSFPWLRAHMLKCMRPTFSLEMTVGTSSPPSLLLFRFLLPLPPVSPLLLCFLPPLSPSLLAVFSPPLPWFLLLPLKSS